MKNSEKSKFQILIVLIGLLGLSLIWNRLQFRTPVFQVPDRKSTRVVSLKNDEVPQLDLLDRRPSGLQVKRDIFRFRDAPVSMPEPGSFTSFAGKPKITTPSFPEIPDVRYVGFYQEKKPSKLKLAAISNGGRIYLGGVGDVLADKYEVIRVDDDFVILKILSDNRILRFSLGNARGRAAILNPGN